MSIRNICFTTWQVLQRVIPISVGKIMTDKVYNDGLGVKNGLNTVNEAKFQCIFPRPGKGGELNPNVP
ncbi:MAG: hypothetical protein P8017_00395 [Deltaproteobacteria bacterium]